MRRQKSILAFFQKPPPENQKSLASDVLGERRDSQLPVKIQNQKASNMSNLTEPLDEIRGTDTPPEKVPRPVLQPKFSSNDGFRGSSVFSSIMHKFVKPGDKESASERNNSLSNSSHNCEVSNKVNKPKEFCEGVSSQLCKNKDIIKSSGKTDQSFVFNVKSDDDIRGPETPGSQRLVSRLKRIQDDDPKSGDKRDRSLLGSVKKMKLSEELMHLNENSGQHSGMASKFEWLDPSRIRDAHERSPSDPFYDKTTLYISPDALKKMSASQRQYWDCKCQYMDIVLFFKVGKFYELYELDAEIGHKELDWKMTLSGVGKCRQVGISESGIDDAIQKLVSRGYKVGRIEQMETSEKAKARGSNSVIQRKLVQVVSPATTIDSNIGPDAVHLLAIKEGNDGLDNGSIVYGFAFADCAALKFWVGSIKDDASFAALGALLMQVSPKEIIYETGGLSKEVQRALRKYSLMGGLSAPQLTAVQPATDFADASEVKSLIQLKGYFKGSSSSRTRVFDSLMHKDIAISALGGITSHLSRLMLDDVLRNGDVLPYEVYKGCLKMDGQTLINLEVFSNSADGGTSGTLFKYLNSCMTSPGKRLLRRWICHPLKDIEGINSRLNVVEYLLEHPEIVLLIAQSLHKLSDLERLLGQIRSTFQSSAPLLLPLLGKKILKQRVRVFGTLVKGLRIAMDLLLVLQKEGQIFALLSTIFKFPKLNGSDGLFQFLTQFEAAIDSDFPNYQNHELKDQDAETLSILIEIFIEKATQWSEVVYAINCIDVLRSFAVNAGVSCGAMSRPVVLPLSKNSTLNQGVSGPIFKITGLWHPFALAESGGVPVPNDIILGEDADSHHPRTLLLTGPNMGGKSTLLRTACLAVILAQLGCYVPCETCVLSLVDIIFTRLGATDRIMAGESTFFIECTETAAVLQNATQDSLVILDELGRGTSTFDGYAIAYAVFRHLIEKINCRLLFATHYHPLTKEFASHPHVTLKHMACKFKTKPGFINISKELVFLYRLASGACPESYGLQVATMAGIPDQVVKAASEAGQTMKESIGESFKCSEMRCEFSTLHEDWLKTLLTVSGTGYSNPDEDDVFDTLLCLWHEVNRSYENFEKSCSG